MIALVVAALSLCHANAETPPLHKVGLLAWEPCDHLDFGSPTPEWEHFLKGMADLGYGKDSGVRLICESANRDPGRIDEAARALLAEKVDIVVAASPFTAGAASRQTYSVPIVALSRFTALITYAQPGGISSGVNDCAFLLTAKRLELLHDALPGLRRVGVLFRQRGTARENIVATERAAKRLSVELEPVAITSLSEIGAAFARMSAAKVDGVFILPDPMIQDGIVEIAERAIESGLPTMTWDTRHVPKGILLAYSCDSVRAEERLAFYVDKLMKGADVGDLPIERPSEFEFSVNARTAARLGLSLPPAVRLFAGEFVE